LTRCGRRYTNSFVLRARAFALETFAILLFAACSTGETQVQGGGTPPTGTTETGSIATGPTAMGPTASGEFDGPVSVDLREAGGVAAGIEAELYSCDGVEGTWTYTVKGGPLDFDIDSTVDMDGGDGTLVISGDIALGGVSASFTDTVDLVVAGTPDAPTLKATKISVEVDSNIPGLTDDLFAGLFRENEEVPVQTGATQC
jgi:hypothetical protein